MNGIWLISYLALWVVVMFLMLAVFVLARQVGLLHRRIAPANARMDNAGPAIGDPAPEINLSDIHGRKVNLGSQRGMPTLLTFVSATCLSCDELAPALRSLWKSERGNLEVLLVSLGGDEATNRNFLARNKLDNIPYIVSKDLGLTYNVLAPPYGLLIDRHGIVRAKGLVNHIEHLESLINAAQLGFPTMESWAQSHLRSDEAMEMSTISHSYQPKHGDEPV